MVMGKREETDESCCPQYLLFGVEKKVRELGGEHQGVAAHRRDW